ncbi:SH3 domain-containing protein [Crocosphaera sp. UHCC 0190]|uniref:SH3 domain-containing protein n=1 Tax=Crocosphaera sp. UHCC 0190 TaxID=3110246 RepID=UPI002B21C011|nr:SH3 domain-containing protein [Crocosphaera sp. UHCC 0190]MEA5511878.1 SH3 domain-containing protein [Crocosphaera sp. UHCC 0190]
MKTKKTITELLTIVLSSVIVFSLPITMSSQVLAQTNIDSAILRSNDPNSRINLRSGPSISTKNLGYGLPGDQVTLLEFAVGSDQGPRVPWIKVKFVKSGAIGWIRGDFVKTDITILTATDPKSPINLRSGPSISANNVGYGLSGDRVIVLGCETGPDTANRTPWIKVQFVKSKATGWIRGDFVVVPLTFC